MYVCDVCVCNGIEPKRGKKGGKRRREIINRQRRGAGASSIGVCVCVECVECGSPAATLPVMFYVDPRLYMTKNFSPRGLEKKNYRTICTYYMILKNIMIYK